jgi:hypothetical protein
MAAPLSFPLSPTLYQTYTANGKTWYWDGATWIYGSGPGGPPDAQFANVLFLAHCDEPTTAYLKDYSRNATDAARIDFASNIDIQGSKTVSSKFGQFACSSSHVSYGLSFHVRLASSFGTGDFTFEGWINPAVSGANMELMDFRTTDAIANGPFVLIKTSNVLAYLKTGAAFDINGVTTLTTSAWHHWHCTRSSGVVYLGLDGSQQGSDVADTTNYTSQDLWIGSQVSTNTGHINGSYDELRVSKYARYARTYTVPTSSFPNY